MITPEQAGTQASTDRQAEIEKRFDTYLARGELTIPKTRSGWYPADIAAVIKKYEAVGWKVADTGGEYVFSK